MSTLAEKVNERFESAKKSNAIFFFESTVTKRMADWLEFSISFVPQLSKKPGNGGEKEKTNPFLVPEEALIVQELENYRILLNKFCVVPRHILIVTKEFKEQNEPLFPEDLTVTWKVLTTAYGTTPCVAFFNCGDLSGASQSHKHIQLIPFEGTGIQTPIVPIFNQIKGREAGKIYNMTLPFLNFIVPFDRPHIDSLTNTDELADYLHQIYYGLLDEMFQQLRTSSAPTQASYNFILTDQFMMVVPRSQEVVEVSEGIKISVNSLGYIGMLLAKNQEERSALEEHANLLDILAQGGVPTSPENTE